MKKPSCPCEKKKNVVQEKEVEEEEEMYGNSNTGQTNS